MREVDLGAAELRETHVSIVFLVGERALKLKKPVRYDFVDLSTREARERMCHREVELNRRLAPDVYLGVADVFGPDHEPCDHLVVMRRMPEARRLSTLVRDGALGDEDLNDLAHVLASFHTRAETSPTIAAAGRVDAVRARWEAGFAEIRPFVGTVLDPHVEEEVERLARRYLDGRAALFADRVTRDKIRDGHGDLLVDDVFILDDGPRVLDCLEFDDELRYGDVLADIAFLAMDLERLDAPDLASRFLAHYRELSGETYPASLAHHYVAFRAHIRAKVACLRDAQGKPGATTEARRLLELALEHLRRGRVVLTLVGGAPGTGKSTLAAGIADRLGWTLLRSDEIRKDLAGLHHTQPAAAAFGTGIYDEQSTATTYGELLDRARGLLEQGEAVVLDATWSDGRQRADAAALAAATSSDLVELRCELPVAAAARRVAARARAGGDASDATPVIAKELHRAMAPWPSAVAIDTGGLRHDAVTAALRAIDTRHAKSVSNPPMIT